jgi:predicted lipoprotein with Yx(FWY)xxD motif
MRFTLAVLVMLLAGQASVQAAEANTAPAEVTLREQGHGWILANPAGMTLYTYADDQKFADSSCDDKCAVTWPPLIATSHVEPTGDWTLVSRTNGTRQWAFRGKPLYTYSRDILPSDMNGDELLQKWYVAIKPVPTPPSFATLKTPAGYLLVDQKKMTLYISEADRAGSSACEGACAKTWKPVEAWSLAESTAPAWSITMRKDGTRQWVFKGKPLYRYAGDFSPGEMVGENTKGWRAVVLEPPPPLPSWVTYQKSDGGELMADASGRTLYAHDLSKPRLGIANSARDMETPHLWAPVLAKSADNPIGQWSMVTRENGDRQWAYKGMPLYTNVRDQEPGALNGMRATDRVWRTIMKSGQSMAGTQN